VAAKEGRGTANGDAAGGGVFSVLLPRSAPGRVRALPDPGSRAATAGFRGNAKCVVWKSRMEAVEASTTCSDHRDFERTLYGSPIACDPRITTITGPLPAAANAIRLSSNSVCDPW
jgi:hypothetical protein